MNKHFIQVTNGLVPVVVLMLLVVALVAGQARANIPGQVTAAAAPTLSAHTSVILNAEMLKRYPEDGKESKNDRRKEYVRFEKTRVRIS